MVYELVGKEFFNKLYYVVNDYVVSCGMVRNFWNNL